MQGQSSSYQAAELPASDLVIKMDEPCTLFSTLRLVADLPASFAWAVNMCRQPGQRNMQCLTSIVCVLPEAEMPYAIITLLCCFAWTILCTCRGDMDIMCYPLAQSFMPQVTWSSARYFFSSRKRRLHCCMPVCKL